ncbi:MAG: DUF86 domain-containing protein [Armatimonadota bacterium]|jgi:uncharacterized protein with HEPN domain
MSRHDVGVSLRQMLDHAREARERVRGRTRSDLDSDRTLDLSLVRLLEILGEAASRVPPGKRTQYPRIPWAGVVGLRNRLIHGYDKVDFDVVWKIASEELDPLIAELERIVPDLEPPP